MIIDTKNKLIFCKSRKTGGSSVQIALSKLLPDSALIVGSVSNNDVVDESSTAGRNRGTAPFFLNHPHTPLSAIARYVDINKYTVATLVRNPYDLVVSRYKWDLKKAGKEHEATYMGFREWLKQYCAPGGNWIYDIQHPYYSLDGTNISVDYIGYYEQLDFAYKGIVNKFFGLGTEIPELGWHKKAKKRDHYSLYYDDECINAVRERFRPDLDILGYEFERLRIYEAVGERHQLFDKDDIGDDNVNGPSMIKRNGIYTLYYANHRGKSIRVMTGQSIDNMDIDSDPIMLEDTVCNTHIASPHAVVAGDVNILYFHGDCDDGQHTFHAILDSNNTLLEVTDSPEAHFYLKTHGQYAIAKKGNECGIIYQASGYGWNPIFELIPNMRHADIKIDGDVMTIFYTRVGDEPEHIRVAVLNMITEEIINDYELLRPMEQWEGVDLPVQPSKFGASWSRVNQLRDPAFFEDDDGTNYLFYSYAGESGIGYVKLKYNG